MHRINTLNPTHVIKKVPLVDFLDPNQYAVHRDPAYQRPACWDGKNSQEYIQSVAMEQAGGAFTMSDVKSNYDACLHHFGPEHEDTQHYKALLDAGITHTSIDGSNRHVKLSELRNSEIALEGPCMIAGPDRFSESYEIPEGESKTLAELKEIKKGVWYHRVLKKNLLVVIWKGCCRDDEKRLFQALNSNTALSPQEKRNAKPGTFSEYIRVGAQQPMPGSILPQTGGEFYGDLRKTLQPADTKRRGSDQIYAKFYLLVDGHAKGAFEEGSSKEISLLGSALDKIYDEQPQNKCIRVKTNKVMKDTLTLSPYIRPKTSQKYFFNTAMFVLGMEDHGLKLNHKAAESDFKELGIFLFDEEDKRKAEFVIPQHVRDQYDDQKWEEVKGDIHKEYCYTSWMSLDSNSSMNKCSWASIEPRYNKATMWSVKRLLEEKPDLCERVFSAVPNTKPRQTLVHDKKMQLLKLQNGRCYLTGVPISKYDIVNRKHADRRVDVDHMRPRVLGGGDGMENLRLAYTAAHIMKGVLVVHDTVNIPFVDHDKEYAKMLGSLPSEDRCLHKVYENHDEEFINYLVIDLDDTDKFAAIRDKFKNELQPSERGEGVPSRSVPPMMSTSSPSMQANV
jgi:hypothetical protein